MTKEYTEKKEHKKLFCFIKIMIVITIMITSLLLYSRYISTKGLQIKEYKIVNSNLPDNFYGYKIVHISDIHYKRTTDKKDLDIIASEINKINPDIVVLTGDLIDKDTKMNDQLKKDLIDFLSKINSKINKYAIKGNHDYNFDNWESIIEESKFINLNDTYDTIYNNGYEPICIIGISSNLKSQLNINEKILKIDETLDKNIKYKILLLHEPDYINEIDINNYNLILAGHSHGGQIRLPLIGPIIKPTKAKKYYNEHYKINETDLYISYGIGTSTISFRLFNKPSFNLYRLTK